MELRELRTFRAVAQALSFHGAADRLGYAQSTVSAQIQALEDELGVRLFDRLGRRILLTDAGTALLHYAGKMLELAEETRSQIGTAGSVRGALTIRIPESLGVCRMPPVIRTFTETWPDVRLRFETCAHDGLAEDLRRGVTDLAFLLSEGHTAADLECEALGVEPIVLAAHPRHKLRKRAKLSTTDLAGETLLVSRADCSYLRTLRALLEDEKVVVDRYLEFSSVATLKACAAEGVGIAVLPAVNLRAELAAKRLAILPWDEAPLEVAILMLWYRGRWISPTLAAFMQAVRDHLPRPQ